MYPSTSVHSLQWCSLFFYFVEQVLSIAASAQLLALPPPSPHKRPGFFQRPIKTPLIPAGPRASRQPGHDFLVTWGGSTCTSRWVSRWAMTYQSRTSMYSYVYMYPICLCTYVPRHLRGVPETRDFLFINELSYTITLHLHFFPTQVPECQH